MGKATRRRQPVSQASAALRIEIGILTWASLLTYAANGGRLPRNCPRAKVIHAFSQSLMHAQRLPEEAEGSREGGAGISIQGFRSGLVPPQG